MTFCRIGWHITLPYNCHPLFCHRVQHEAHLLSLALLSTSLSHAASIELDTITVTGTREGQALSKTPQAISKISGEDIDKLKAQHASQVMNQAAGVWVNVTGGEGHLTAIRQPITTSPVYLYPEDGIPRAQRAF